MGETPMLRSRAGTHDLVCSEKARILLSGWERVSNRGEQSQLAAGKERVGEEPSVSGYRDLGVRRDESHQIGGDPVQGDDLLRGAAGDGLLGHAEDDAGLFILS